MYKVHLCRFDAVSDLRGKHRTYENIKAAVLKAGKFSVFDVETNKDGRLLCFEALLRHHLLKSEYQQ